jgi:hypothetical protein
MTGDAEGEAARARLLALLDRAAVESRRIDFWWRDDDAEDVTPALDRLLSLAKRCDLPLAVAVVPKRATEALAARLETEPRVTVLQHGWAHTNHAAAGEKKIELGGARSVSEMLEDLRRGRERLEALFPKHFLPVLAPPWNRIADCLRGAIGDAGLRGLSTIGPKSAPGEVNVHLDIFVWRPARRTISRAEAFSRLAAEVERRLQGAREPIGIMTHHLVHEEESWALLDDLLQATAKHPAVKWPEIKELFEG